MKTLNREYLKPGDLIFNSTESGKVIRVVRSLYRRNSAKWNHVAIVLNVDEILEAVPNSGVSIVPVTGYAESANDIAVYRLNSIALGDFSTEVLNNCATVARNALGQDYSLSSFRPVPARRWQRFLSPLLNLIFFVFNLICSRPRGLYCSSHIVNAYRQIERQIPLQVRNLGDEISLSDINMLKQWKILGGVDASNIDPQDICDSNEFSLVCAATQTIDRNTQPKSRQNLFYSEEISLLRSIRSNRALSSFLKEQDVDVNYGEVIVNLCTLASMNKIEDRFHCFLDKTLENLGWNTPALADICEITDRFERTRFLKRLEKEYAARLESIDSSLTHRWIEHERQRCNRILDFCIINLPTPE